VTHEGYSFAPLLKMPDTAVFNCPGCRIGLQPEREILGVALVKQIPTLDVPFALLA